MGWFERHLGGHISIGPLTVYGFNGMHVALNLYTKRWGYVCFHPPMRVYSRWWGWYFYVSPNATPWAATFLRGASHREERHKADGRRQRWGHNFDVDLLRAAESAA